MDKDGHLLVGFVIGIIFIIIMHAFLDWFSLDMYSIFTYTFVILIYCLMPDVDTKSSSIIWVIFIPLSILGMGYGFYMVDNSIMIPSFILLIIVFIAAAWMPHRGFIHSLTFDFIVSAPLAYFFDYQIAILAFICFWSHLVADEEYLKIV